MCGIVGAVSKRPIAQLLLEGLKRLEYRGYDSAGIAVIDTEQKLQRLRVLGKVKELEHALKAHPLHAHTGIAHTRWATHGAPSEYNAHPFISHDQFALVHNGIIENHVELRKKLIKEKYEFLSETDTETIVHLIHYHHSKTKDFLQAVRESVNELKGAYALGIFFTQFPNRIIGVRQGAPLVVGKGKGENFLASDPLALLSVTQQFIYFEDYDIADITLDAIKIYDKKSELVERETHALTINLEAVERGRHRHFMLKEILEQPDAISFGLEGRIANDHVLPGIFGPKSAIFSEVKHVQLVACGTSYHAALTARYWIESISSISCSVEVASEFRYHDVAKPPNSLFVTLSQSGETADTMGALRLAKEKAYLSTLGICNVPGSTMTRETDITFLIRAGIEIAVASTKGFIAQLIALFLLTLSLRKTHAVDDQLEVECVKQLEHLPAVTKKVLQQEEFIINWAKSLTDKQHAIFLGRGALYPIALEGALKMKEISYVHAEAYPAGELKHGPLALIDENMPVFALAPNDHLLEKTFSNLREVCARGGKLYILTDNISLFQQDDAFAAAQIIAMPAIHPLLAPILYTIPLQLLAYHLAVLKGTDVDQPRNLAKSVTVE